MVTGALLASGKQVLKPLSDGLRYDLAVDDGSEILRVQCKSAVFRHGAVVFHANSSTGRKRVGYRGEADFFGVYCAEIHRCYLIPVAAVGLTSVRLRVESPKNNQKTGLRDAAAYEIPIRGPSTTPVYTIHACPDCGAQVTSKGRRCVNCRRSRHQSFKIEWPDHHELLLRLEGMSLRALARELGVTDSAIKGHLATMGVTYKKRTASQAPLS